MVVFSTTNDDNLNGTFNDIFCVQQYHFQRPLVSGAGTNWRVRGGVTRPVLALEKKFCCAPSLFLLDKYS